MVAVFAGESVASVIAEGVWLALLLVLPAAFNPLGTLAFEPLKVSVLRGGAALLAAAWLVRRLRRADASAGSATVDVGAHPVVRAGLALIGAAAVATVLSVEPLVSFFGSFDRGIGWLTLAAGGVLLLSGADLFADARRRERAITALLLGSVIPCAYLLVQRVGLDPITWTTLGAPGSSLASPTFLGGYLVIVAPFALYRVVGSARTASIAYAGWLALLLVVCAVTVLTTIRGPMLGLGVGLAAFGALASPRLHIGRLRLAAAGVGGIVVALVLAMISPGSSGASGLQRFLSIAQPGDSSIERLTAWHDALGLPLGDPLRALIGFGPETQQASMEFGEATIRLTQNQQWDRAHNLLLDAWLTGGGLGVIALIVVIGLAMRSAWQARAGGGLLWAAVLAALIGHLVEVSFAFHTVMTEALFWLLLGLAASLTPRYVNTHRQAPTAIAGIGVVAAVALVPLMVTPAIADSIYGQARRTDYLSGAHFEELAAGWAPWVEELPRAAALDWQHVATARDDATARDQVAPDLRAAAARAPAEPLPQLRLTLWYWMQADLTRAEASCELALARGPYRAAIWDACADVSAAQGRADIAPARRARGEVLRHPL